MRQPISELFLVFTVCVNLCNLSDAQSPKEFTNSIGMRFALIPKGSFMMGSPESEAGRARKGEDIRKVTISKNFYLGVYEVTQSQYLKITGKNPSYFKGENLIEFDARFNEKKEIDNADHPVERVKWDEAVDFCKLLSEIPEEKNAGRVYRLPTEAEWEYACRAGSKSAYCFGDEEILLRDYGWFNKNGQGRTHSVGIKNPNKLGLFNMHGNVSEWCSDWYDSPFPLPSKDPKGPVRGEYKVHRGGNFNVQDRELRSATRGWHNPDLCGSWIGLRVLCSVSPIRKDNR